MSPKSYDPRITPARPDLAARSLANTIEAPAYAEGRTRVVMAPLAPVRAEPSPSCSLSTEALRGEHVTVYDEAEGWAWVQLARDSYVGYLPADALNGPRGRDAEPQSESATHKVAVLRTLVFPGPSLKLPIVGGLPLGAEVAVRRTVDGYAEVAEGWVWAGNLRDLAWREPDFVAVAERFLEVPYLWGGKSSLGLDCSGLVQVALRAAGIDAPRDSDMQERWLGSAVPENATLQRGDLVFWKGHVGIMRDAETLIHANAHAMMVWSEPFSAARDRIGRNTGATVTAIRRLPASA